jgi:hypothetical protein
MNILLAVLLSAPIAVSAQAAQGNGSSNEARVDIYRYKQAFAKGIRPSIVVDEIDVARLQDGRSVVLTMPAGIHTFRSNDAQSRVELELKAGQVYYIRIDIAPGLVKGHGRVMLVQPEQGAAEFKQMKSADANMIKDRQFLAPDFVPEKSSSK